MTAADRQSVTDNARAEAWRRFPDGIDPETGEPVDDYGYPATAREAFIGGAEWAAGRTETTTATIEDTARAIHRALAPRWMSVAQALGLGQDAYEAMLADIAQAIADAGLLATARTRPTREQIITALDHEGAFCGVCGREPGDPLDDCDDCRRCLHRYADAVLALYADQPTESETTTETTYEAVQEVARLIDSCIPDRKDAYGFRHAMKAAVAMSERGLLATARAKTTTATVEDAARVRAQIAVLLTRHAQSVLAREGVFDSDETSEAVDAILALLATARTRPTREQIAAVVHHVGWEVPQGYEDNLDPENCATCRDALNTADAVLALLRGGA